VWKGCHLLLQDLPDGIFQRPIKNKVTLCCVLIIALSTFLFMLCLVGSAQAQQQGNSDSNTKNTSQIATQSEELELDESALSDSEQRELGASEDPDNLSSVQRDAQRQKDVYGEPVRAAGFDIYGSLRLRNRKGSEREDGGSRAGLGVESSSHRNSYLFARYETGFDMLSIIGANEGDEDFHDTLSKRLSYVGLDTPSIDLTAGKNWSSYYEVGGFTDRFSSTGGTTSGVFNANTDGGPTGTGRADGTVQTKISLDFLPHKVFEPFELNLQVQQGNPIPFGGGAKYGTAVGVSSVMTTRKNLAIGVAYNHADIDLNINQSLREIGISGSAQALIVGARAFGERWYAGMVLSRLKNHMTTDQGIYFNGWGGELYGQYQLSRRWWFAGGYNFLKPDSDQTQAGEYRVRYAVAEMRFTFDKFRRMLFANVRFNDDQDADGSSDSNVYTVGVRWDLSSRGWHVSN
jgi:predicted porin